MDQIVGYIERITFQNPENGYTVAKLQQPRHRDVTCIVGFMPTAQPGETVRCQGEWKRHLVHGMQFDVKSYKTESPADVIGIKKYLGSGLIKGIGPVYAGRIVELFGTETLNIIDTEPERLSEIAGLGQKRIKKICSCWDEQKSVREVMIFLQSHEVSPAFAQKIFRVYGKKSVQVVQETPFLLARDIHGIGFKTADQIAEKIGIAKDSAQRIEAGILFVLSELSNNGHVCYPQDPFLKEAETMLEVDKSLIEDQLASLHENKRIEIKDQVFDGVLQTFLWIKPLYISERGIAKELLRLHQGSTSLRAIDQERALKWVQEKLNISLGENQKSAVTLALSEKVQIITGGPGTGKSTITNAILTITEKLTERIILAAPTGRAAKRMSEITGKKASTIHSLLEFDFRAGGFKRNREKPLDCDLLIVDEASMIDTQLMYSLLKAIPGKARVIFVGDIDQLPSVGPGNVLKDIIHSRTIAVTILTEIFRQGAGSRIVTSAHRINQGKFPDLNNSPDSDFFFISEDDKEILLSQLTTLVTQRIPKKYGFDPIDAIQVLAPMKRGVIGTENLNFVLQEALNPKNPPIFKYGRRFAKGDKVMQIRNNYDKKVYNGDVGRIEKIDEMEQKLFVKMEEEIIEYDFADLDELVLAYAVSVHKYQGSECPCIIMPVHTSHFKLLHRNLLYTGVTRGKKLVILIGMKKALAIAVKNDEVMQRYTGLLCALTEHYNPARL
jgi:exodeoxyribonuclease V alpha subunit